MWVSVRERERGRNLLVNISTFGEWEGEGHGGMEGGEMDQEWISWSCTNVRAGFSTWKPLTVFKDKYSANTESELISLLLTFSSVVFSIQPWFSLQFTGFSCRWWHPLPPRQTISTVTIEGFATDLTVTMDTAATTLATWHQVSHEIILKHVYPASLLTAAKQADEASAAWHYTDSLPPIREGGWPLSIRIPV